MPTIDHDPSQPPIERTTGRWKVVVQIACIAVTAFVLFAFREGFIALDRLFGPGFVWGNIFGAALVIILYLVIIWIDPSSRPRGSSANK